MATTRMKRNDELRESLGAREPLASNRNLIGFGVVCVIFTLIGVNAQMQSHAASPGAARADLAPLYIGTMLGEWGLLYFVWRGVRKNGFDLFGLIGRTRTWQATTLDLAIGIVFGLFLVWLDALVQHLLGTDPADSVQNLLPTGPLEMTLWVGVSVTAGFVEEFVFRGYLLRQLAARFGNVWVAVLAQGAWFAAMHAYEGLRSVISICAIGVIFGLVAAWRKQLRTNIVAHSVVDIVEGLAPKFIRF